MNTCPTRRNPSARKRRGAAGATRTRPFYQFADRAALDRGSAPGVIKRLVADFDKAWSGVPRSREIMTIAEEI